MAPSQPRLFCPTRRMPADKLTLRRPLDALPAPVLAAPAFRTGSGSCSAPCVTTAARRYRGSSRRHAASVFQRAGSESAGRRCAPGRATQATDAYPGAALPTATAVAGRAWTVPMPPLAAAHRSSKRLLMSPFNKSCESSISGRRSQHRASRSIAAVSVSQAKPAVTAGGGERMRDTAMPGAGPRKQPASAKDVVRSGWL